MEVWTGGRRDRATGRRVISFSIYLIISLASLTLMKNNLPYRLAQLRESGILFRFRQHYLPSKEPDTEPSSIVVSLVTVAPILVLLAAGNIIGFLILVIEKYFHGDMFKPWTLRNIR
jgi:hypothetical protein